MGRDGLFIGEVAAKSGVSRKALRLYEAAGILPSARRTQAGYRLYGRDALDVLGFVARARRLGFTLTEIGQIVSLKRSGRVPARTCGPWCAARSPTSTERSPILPRCESRFEDSSHGALTAAEPARWSARASRRPTFLDVGSAIDQRLGKEDTDMDTVKLLLCPAGCGECPEVEIAGDEIRIGEAGNLAVLKREEWNVLVDLIQSGRLRKL